MRSVSPEAQRLPKITVSFKYYAQSQVDDLYWSSFEKANGVQSLLNVRYLVLKAYCSPLRVRFHELILAR